MNWPLISLIAFLSLAIIGIWIITALLDRIDALLAEIDRLRGVKTQEAGA